MKLQHRLGYVPALDGIRALAIIGVVVYHLNFAWLPGGYLGVDLFFAISGYVITWLLLDEIRTTNAINLRSFFTARARRLLPALLTLCLATAIFAGLWAKDSVKRFLIDTPFAIFGLTNWRLVANQQNYFEEIGRPPLLQHTWSLAVEAQFYAIWPLAILLVWKYLDSKRIRLLALSAAAASTAGLLALGSDIAHASSSTVSHLYFGTDVHCVSLFLGAALAIAWIPRNLSRDVSPAARNLIDFVGLSAFAGIIAMFVFAGESSISLYRVSFPITGALGALLIASLVHPASRLAYVFSIPALRWIGERSYGIYLWHWVLFQVTRPGVDVSGSLASVAFRCGLVLVVAEISYRFIEMPIRRGRLRAYVAQQRATPLRKRALTVSGLVAPLVAVLGVTIAVDANAISTRPAYNLVPAKLGTAKSPVLAVTGQPSAAATPSPTSTTDASGTATVWVVGDSVMLGVENALVSELPISAFDAKVGRQAEDVARVLSNGKAAPSTTDVIINLGNNSPLSTSTVEQIFQALSQHPISIVVNARVPRVWQEGNDNLIARMASKYPRVQVVDWYEASKDHREYFVGDGVHLTSQGINAYVNLIVQAYQG